MIKCNDILSFLKSYVLEKQDDKTPKIAHFQELPNIDKKSLNKITNQVETGQIAYDIINPIIDNYKYNQEIINSLYQTSKKEFSKQEFFVFFFQMFTILYEIRSPMTTEIFTSFLRGLDFAPSTSETSFFASELLLCAVNTPTFIWTVDILTDTCSYIVANPWIGYSQDFNLTFTYFVSRIHQMENAELTTTLLSFLYRLYCENYPITKQTDHYSVIEFISSSIGEFEVQSLGVFEIIMKVSNSPKINVVLHELADSFVEKITQCPVSIHYTDADLKDESPQEEIVFENGVPSLPKLLTEELPDNELNDEENDLVNSVLPIFKLDRNFEDSFFLSLISAIKECEKKEFLYDFICCILEMLKINPEYRLIMVFYNNLADNAIFFPEQNVFSKINRVTLSFRRQFLDLLAGCESKMFPGILLLKHSTYPILFTEIVGYIVSRRDKIKMKLFENGQIINATVIVAKKVMGNKRAFAVVLEFTCLLIETTNALISEDLSDLIDVFISSVDCTNSILPVIFSKLASIEEDVSLNYFKRYISTLFLKCNEKLRTRLLGLFADLINCNPVLVKSLQTLTMTLSKKLTTESILSFLRFFAATSLSSIDNKVIMEIGNILKKIDGFIDNRQIFSLIICIISGFVNQNPDYPFMIRRSSFVCLLMIVYGESEEKVESIFALFNEIGLFSSENFRQFNYANVDYMIMCCMKNGFKKTRIQYEGISFDLMISRRVYDEYCAKLLENISILKSGVLLLNVFHDIFTSKKKDIIAEASVLLNTLLPKSTSFIRESLVLDYADYSKIIDDFHINWSAKNTLEFDILVDERILEMSNVMINIMTFADEDGHMLRFELSDAKVLARVITHLKAHVVLFHTNLWNCPHRISIQYEPNGKGDAVFKTKLDGNDYGEAYFFEPTFTSKVKLYFGGGLGTKEWATKIIAIGKDFAINGEPFSFNTNYNNIIQCAAKFDFANRFVDYFNDFSTSDFQNDLRILCILESIFRYSEEAQKSFDRVLDLFRVFATNPKKVCYNLYKSLYSIYNAITYKDLKRAWFMRLIINFTIWSKCDPVSFVLVILHYSTIVINEEFIFESNYMNCSLFSEFLIYFRMLFCRIQDDPIHPHEIKLAQMKEAEKQKCFTSMMTFLKKLALRTLTAHDVEILYSLLYEAEKPEVYLELIRDLAAEILKQKPEFAEMLLEYEVPLNRKDAIEMYVMAIHNLNPETLHGNLAKLASKCIDLPFAKEIHADLIENIRRYPNIYTFIFEIENTSMCSSLPVMISVLKDENLVKRLLLKGLWYLPFIQHSIEHEAEFREDTYQTLLSLLPHCERPEITLIDIINMIIFIGEKTRKGIENCIIDSLTAVLSRLRYELFKFSDACFYSTSFIFLFSLRPRKIRSGLSQLINENHEMMEEKIIEEKEQVLIDDVSTNEELCNLLINEQNITIASAYETKMKVLDLAILYYNLIKSPTKSEKELFNVLTRIKKRSYEKVSAFEETNNAIENMMSKYFESMRSTLNFTSTLLFVEVGKKTDIYQQKKMANSHKQAFYSLVEKSFSRAIAFAPRLIRNKTLYRGVPMLMKNKVPMKKTSIISKHPNKLEGLLCDRVKLMTITDAAIQINDKSIKVITATKEKVIDKEAIESISEVRKNNSPMSEIRLKDGNTYLLKFNDKQSQKRILSFMPTKKLVFNSNETSFNIIMKVNTHFLGRSFNSQTSYPLFPVFIKDFENLGIIRDFSNDTSFEDPPSISRVFGKRRYTLCEEIMEHDFILADFLFNFDSVIAGDKLPKSCKDKYDFIYQMRRAIESDRFRTLLPRWLKRLKVDFKFEKSKIKYFFDSQNKSSAKDEEPEIKTKSSSFVGETTDQITTNVGAVRPRTRPRRLSNEKKNTSSQNETISLKLGISNLSFVQSCESETGFSVFASSDDDHILRVFDISPGPQNAAIKETKQFKVSNFTLQKSKECVIGTSNVGTVVVFSKDKDKQIGIRGFGIKCASNNMFICTETGRDFRIPIRDSYVTVLSDEIIIDIAISDEFQLVAFVSYSKVQCYSTKNGRMIFVKTLNETPKKVSITEGFGLICVSFENKVHFFTPDGKLARTFDNMKCSSLFSCYNFDFFISFSKEERMIKVVNVFSQNVVSTSSCSMSTASISFNKKLKTAITIESDGSITLHNMSSIFQMKQITV